MSANWWAGELRKTRRYELGQQLGSVARHLLLMTAAPHAGSEENFQAFLALLDPDRFEGQYRAGVGRARAGGCRREPHVRRCMTEPARNVASTGSAAGSSSMPTGGGRSPAAPRIPVP
jgi:hypothetical protein